MPQGHGQVIVSWAATRADEAFGPDGKLHRQSPYRKHEAEAYAEYGWTPDITLTGETAYTMDDTDFYGEDHRTSGISRIEAGARYALGTWQQTLFSIQPLAILNGTTSGDDPASPRRGEVDGEFDVTLGRNFSLLGLDGFNDTLIGYRYRGSGRPDEVKTEITMGFKPGPRIMLLVKSENFWTISGDRQTSSDVTRNKLGLSFVRELTPKVSLEICGIETLSGRNSIRERSMSLGLWYRF